MKNKYVEEWAKEGRTEEQIYGVKNFLTSKHFKKLFEEELEKNKLVWWSSDIMIKTCLTAYKKDLVKWIKKQRKMDCIIGFDNAKNPPAAIRESFIKLQDIITHIEGGE